MAESTDTAAELIAPPPGVPNPLLLIAELTYRCPLHCPYCSNPTDIGAGKYQDELPAEDWQRVFREAADLGVLQLALTGGEPMARKEIVELVTDLDRERASTRPSSPRRCRSRSARVEALHAAGLDHVQISFQHSDPALADEIGGTIAFDRKVKAAALAKELDFPLTINCVLHRRNIDAVGSIIQMAEELGARRLELANTQYHGWATVNRDALMPTRAQLERGEEIVMAERERLGPKLEILWVLPDYYEEVPKPCMGGWAHDAVLVQPNGDVLPCQAAASIPGLKLENVRDKSLAEIWFESEMLQRLPRHRVDAGALPHLPDQPPARGLRRLPLPGAGADRRRGGDRPGLPVLPAPRRDRQRPP